ncbi:aminotransferase class I/II-fold pyridoxal phosphate-dependent enzyme [Marinomonas transparens]|uniref:Pyridoxal phosphate-dependent aminotransferase n=1 Tax=Marinomonas transparens TaxID=2795388 RepID=A0A934JIS9_9GAMM|nr:pyridoxal phosphate-dependent aminotransferase [Marinomonas transparens]MBJ7536566.1 pyridoxal phosphate-dependent aminotransferase [Marinomonas transparens]
MLNKVIDPKIVTQQLKESSITSMARASIRELVSLINGIERESGQKYVRMEMGVPGLPAPQIGIEAEISALHQGVASKYPMIEGIPELKKEISRFCSMFLDISVNEVSCFPTVGSAQGALATFLVGNRMRPQGATLFIDPGFPNQKRQLDMIGQSWGSFDVYEHRGSKLKPALEKHLGTGKYTTLLYSNPNNPAWICFNDEELASIAEVADKYDVIVIEDLAYFGMDYREDYSIPGQGPYQPTVAKYTDNYVLLISSSKVFSYAGQRIGSMVISNELYKRQFDNLKDYFGQTQYGKAITFGALHGLSSGVTHSTQYGLAAMLKAANDNELPFLNLTKVYAKRAEVMKELFLNYGFNIVYAEDNGKPLSDGFYFTISYPGMDGDALLTNLLYVGISAISLANTGSEHIDGARACVSQVKEDQIPILTERLKAFSEKFIA